MACRGHEGHFRNRNSAWGPDFSIGFARPSAKWVFAPLAAWRRSFDLVYECNTIQILSGTRRQRAAGAIADLVAVGGDVIVSCRSRESAEQEDAFPVPLARDEIDAFRRCGLSEMHFVAYDDDRDLTVPHYFAVHRRTA